jgi:hypothetical protein
MNQKGFAPVIILLVIAVASAAAFGIWYKTRPAVERQIPESQAVLVVKTFCDNFFKGPPAINEQGVMIAFDFLSQKARQSMSVTGPSPSAALAGFAGVQDVPDQGYTIDEISEGVEKATIKTTWKYASGPVVKTFELGKENGIWKIDALR